MKKAGVEVKTVRVEPHGSVVINGDNGGLLREDMPRKRYAFTVQEFDRFGNERWYFRIGKGKRIRLPAPWGSKEFEAEWRRCMANEEPAPAPTTQMPGLLIASRGLHRSFARKRLIPYPANEAGCTWVGFSKLAHQTPIEKITARTHAEIHRDRKDYRHTRTDYREAL